jgi:molecular chaperone HtpG
VGFYSAFIVADRVTLTTRRTGAEPGSGVRWTSDGRGEYTLEAAEVPARGTTIVLHLRDGEEELLSGFRLRSIIRKYSDHISLPILMPAEQEGEPEETVNKGSALWARPKTEISDQDYNEFYKHISSDYADPLGWVHSKIEGTYEYTLLLFIPAHAPFDMWFPDPAHGVRLHVRRIFILEDSGQLLPRYLRFLRGVIDSADLPLNVSRELLQGSRVVDRIRSSAVKRVLQFLKDMAEKEPEKYATFWKEFGSVLKEGVVEDFSSRDDLAGLLRFTSTVSDGEAADVPLRDYVARMKEGQDSIYYLVAPTLAAAASSPHLEAFGAKGVEVLLLADPVDHWLVSSLPEFEGKRLQSVADGAADLSALQDDAEKTASEQASAELADLVGKLKTILAGQAFDVRVTSRLTTSPSCIVANGPELEVNLARRLAGSGLPSQPVLEINPGHPVVQWLNRHQDDPRLGDWAHVLFGQAVLTLGARIDDPATFVARLNELLRPSVTEDPA